MLNFSVKHYTDRDFKLFGLTTPEIVKIQQGTVFISTNNVVSDFKTKSTCPILYICTCRGVSFNHEDVVYLQCLVPVSRWRVSSIRDFYEEGYYQLKNPTGLNLKIVEELTAAGIEMMKHGVPLYPYSFDTTILYLDSDAEKEAYNTFSKSSAVQKIFTPIVKTPSNVKVTTYDIEEKEIKVGDKVIFSIMDEVNVYKGTVVNISESGNMTIEYLWKSHSGNFIKQKAIKRNKSVYKLTEG